MGLKLMVTNIDKNNATKRRLFGAKTHILVEKTDRQKKLWHPKNERRNPTIMSFPTPNGGIETKGKEVSRECREEMEQAL